MKLTRWQQFAICGLFLLEVGILTLDSSWRFYLIVTAAICCLVYAVAVFNYPEKAKPAKKSKK
jgi:hypothetical protein